MQAQHGEFSISGLCRTLEVSRSGYYEWRSRPPRAQGDADQQVQDKIQCYFAQGRGTYGTRRLKHLLAQEGLQVSRCRIGRSNSRFILKILYDLCRQALAERMACPRSRV